MQEMINRKQRHINNSILNPLIKALGIIETISHIKICCDPDNNKFLEYAEDSHALYSQWK